MSQPSTPANPNKRPDLRIVRATMADAHKVAPLFDAYRVFYNQPSNEPAALEFLRDRIRSNEGVVLMALVREGAMRLEAVGAFTQLYPSFTSVGMARTWILNDLYVKPEHRRGGLARALITEAEAFAARTGAVSISLLTAHTNAPAKTLYESLGWSIDPVYARYKKALTPL